MGYVERGLNYGVWERDLTTGGMWRGGLTTGYGRGT